MYGSESDMGGRTTIPYLFCVCLAYSSEIKLGCVTNFDMLFLVMGFISLKFSLC